MRLFPCNCSRAPALDIHNTFYRMTYNFLIAFREPLKFVGRPLFLADRLFFVRTVSSVETNRTPISLEFCLLSKPARNSACNGERLKREKV